MTILVDNFNYKIIFKNLFALYLRFLKITILRVIEEHRLTS